MYGDLECILEKTDPSSYMYHHHRIGYAMYIALTTIRYQCISFVALRIVSHGSPNNLEI